MKRPQRRRTYCMLYLLKVVWVMRGEMCSGSKETKCNLMKDAIELPVSRGVTAYGDCRARCCASA